MAIPFPPLYAMVFPCPDSGSTDQVVTASIDADAVPPVEHDGAALNNNAIALGIDTRTRKVPDGDTTDRGVLRGVAPGKEDS